MASDSQTAVTVEQAGEQLRKVQAHLTETVWLVAEAFGAKRDCAGCQKVVRHLDQRDLGYVCALHGRRADRAADSLARESAAQVREAWIAGRDAAMALYAEEYDRPRNGPVILSMKQAFGEARRRAYALTPPGEATGDQRTRPDDRRYEREGLPKKKCAHVPCAAWAFGANTRCGSCERCLLSARLPDGFECESCLRAFEGERNGEATGEKETVDGD